MKYFLKFKNTLPILVLIIMTILVCIPLFSNGFFTMHDDEQVARLFDLNAALLAGQFPPRIVPNLGFGYGYLFFNFYPPFAYYVAEVFHLLGFGFILSTKLMLVSGFFMSGFFMYLLAKEFFGRLGGLIASAFYIFAPYHAVDIYVRGAFAEFTAFVFLPAVLWYMVRISKNNSYRNIVGSAISISFLILSHNLIMIMFLPFVLLWIGFLSINIKKRVNFLLSAFVSLVLGFGISAYFWIPSFFEKGQTLVSILTTELADYNLHFVCVHQLISSPWGYGGSIPSCDDGLSFQIGVVNLAIIAVVVALTIYGAMRTKLVKNYTVIVFSIIMFLFATFMTVKYSKVIWDSLSPLWYIQFPWRFLMIAVFFASFVGGGIIVFVKSDRAKIFLAGLLLAALVVFNINFFKPERSILVKDSYYTNQEKIRWDTSSLAYEYVPSGISTKKSQYDTTLVNISKNEIAKNAFKPTSKLSVNVLYDLPQKKAFSVESEKGGLLQVSTFNYPGWIALIDNKDTKISSNNKLKLVEVYVPEGKHEVKLNFSNTTARNIGNFTSVICIIIASVLLIKSKKNNGKA